MSIGSAAQTSGYTVLRCGNTLVGQPGPSAPNLSLLQVRLSRLAAALASPWFLTVMTSVIGCVRISASFGP